jgi:hypothetical protein
MFVSFEPFPTWSFWVLRGQLGRKRAPPSGKDALFMVRRPVGRNNERAHATRYESNGFWEIVLRSHQLTTLISQNDTIDLEKSF